MLKINSRGSKGFTIIEVLVAAILIALAFVSMIAVQIHASHYSATVYFRGIASQIANGVAANIRANPDGLKNYKSAAGYEYDPNYIVTGVANCTMAATVESGQASTCTSLALAEADMAWLRRNAKNQLPGGDVYVKVDGKYADVVLLWQNTNSKDAALTFPCLTNVPIKGGVENVQCVTVRVRI